METGYIYLGSPYSDPSPVVREARYLAAAEATAILLKNYQWVYSPIVHCHDVAKLFDMPKGFDFWGEYNFCMLDSAASMTVLTLRGWQASVGLGKEIERAIKRGKQITYLSGVTDVEAFCRGYPNRAKPAAP